MRQLQVDCREKTSKVVIWLVKREVSWTPSFYTLAAYRFPHTSVYYESSLEYLWLAYSDYNSLAVSHKPLWVKARSIISLSMSQGSCMSQFTIWVTRRVILYTWVETYTGYWLQVSMSHLGVWMVGDWGIKYLVAQSDHLLISPKRTQLILNALV